MTTDLQEICPNCLRKLFGTRNYCPFCGANIIEIHTLFQEMLNSSTEVVAATPTIQSTPEVKSVEVEPKSEPVEERIPPPATPPARKKKLVPVASVVILGLGGLVVATQFSGAESQPTNAASSASSLTSSATPEDTEPAVTLVSWPEVQDSPEAEEVALRFCSDLSESIEIPDFLPRAASTISAEVDNIRSSSAAKKYVSDNSSWIRKTMVDEFRISLRSITNPGVPEIVAALGFDNASYEIDKTPWQFGLNELAVNVCQLEQDLALVEDQVAGFQQNVDRVIELAR